MASEPTLVTHQHVRKSRNQNKLQTVKQSCNKIKIELKKKLQEVNYMTFINCKHIL